MENIKVNGEKFTSMKGRILRSNDRICIGPMTIFLYINKLTEHDASMLDFSDNPITYDFASEEIYNA